MSQICDTVFVRVLDACSKEIKDFSGKAKQDLFELIGDLSAGVNLSMPLSRKMLGMGKGISELRLKDKDGIYRVIYFVKKKDCIYLVHAFKKKTQKTPQKNIDLAMKRIKRLL